MKEKAEKAVVAYYAFDRAVNHIRDAKNYVKNKYVHTVTVSSKDYIYKDLQQWIFSNSDADALKTLVAETVWTDSTTIISPDSYLSSTKALDSAGFRYQLQKFINTKTTKKFTYKGFNYSAFTSQMDKTTMTAAYSIEPEKLIISCYSKEAQDTLFELMESIVSTKLKQNKVVQLMTERYDEWCGTPLMQRNIDSVFLHEGQKERLIDDIQRFIDDEPNYVKFNLPYHRGYLLYGVPGSGKTSTVKALANHFKMDIYYLSLSEVKRDSKLLQMINQINPRSIILLEDIDVLSVTNDRENNKEHDDLTLAGLLNALDGVGTPHGLIYFMTSNAPDELDDALIRNGRIDMREHMDYCDNYQVAEAFEYFYDRPLTTVPILDNMTLADVMEIFKVNMHDADAAEAALNKKE